MKSDDTEVRTLITLVGRAVQGDNLYRGYSVRHELAGRDGFWSTLSLAVGGPRLDRDQASMLDDLNACCLAADPRIWPLKAARLAASYGSALTGLVVGMLVADGDRVGPKFIEKTAALLVEIDANVPQPDLDVALAPLLDRWIAEKRQLFGFGVPFRDRDERVDAVRECVVRRGRQEGRYWRLMEAVGTHLGNQHRLPPNICAAACAVLLDMRLTPSQTVAIQWALALAPIWANASEGAQRPEPQLRSLPTKAIRYVGKAARLSPRASAHSES